MVDASTPSRGTTATPRETPTPPDPRPPGPVDRAFTLLQIVVAAPQPIGVRELARRAGLPASTTARTLGILDDLGMVERTSDGSARPGAALATLTRQTGQSPASLRDRLRPLTVDLVREFGENAAVAIDDGTGALYVVSSRAPGALQVPDPTGSSYPFHLVAPGLVLMSHWEQHRLDRYVVGELRSATPHSVTEPSAIRQRLLDASKHGHIWTNEELDIEVNGLATAVVDRDGAMVAAVSLYGPAHRLNRSARPTLANDLQAFVAQRSLN